MRKEWNQWSQKDVDYHQQRNELAKKVDLTEYLDQPIVFTSRQSLTGILTRTKLFEMVLDVQGSVVECGVYKGSSLMLYAHLSSILEPYAFNRKVYGFDTFQGFRSLSGNDPKDLNENMFHDADYEVLKEMIQINDGNRALPQIAKCEIIKGDAVQTIPEFTKNHPELIIALLYLDFDIYEPTRIALEHFLPLVPKGGVVALDELNAQRWAGETIAFKEKLNLSSVNLKKFPFDPWPSYFVVGS